MSIENLKTFGECLHTWETIVQHHPLATDKSNTIVSERPRELYFESKLAILKYICSAPRQDRDLADFFRF